MIGGCFFVVSKLGTDPELVMDLKRSNTNPGTQVILYPQHQHFRNNQLWMKEQAGEATFYLVSKLSTNCKIAIKVINITVHV